MRSGFAQWSIASLVSCDVFAVLVFLEKAVQLFIMMCWLEISVARL